MVLEREAQFTGHFLLQLFNFVVFKFEDFATAHADQMVVMVTRLMELKYGTAIEELALHRETRFDEAIYRAIHTGQTHARRLFLYGAEKVFGTYVPASAEKLRNDNFALIRKLQLVLREIELILLEKTLNFRVTDRAGSNLFHHSLSIADTLRVNQYRKRSTFAILFHYEEIFPRVWFRL